MAMQVEQTTESASALRLARFTGSFAGKLDAKGRVVVPTEFRAQLGSPDVWVFPSLTDEVLQLGPQRLVDDLLSLVSGNDVYDEDRWLLEEQITSGALRLTIDDTGRISLPKEFQAHAKLDGAVGFAGRDWHFVLAPKSYLDAQRERAAAAALRNRDTLKARQLPSVRGGSKS